MLKFQDFNQNVENNPLPVTLLSGSSSGPNLFPLPLPGELSLEEFVAGARSDEDFMEVMIKSLDLAHIVAMINSRRHSV